MGFIFELGVNLNHSFQFSLMVYYYEIALKNVTSFNLNVHFARKFQNAVFMVQ